MSPGERGHLFLVTDSSKPAPRRDEELVAAFLRDESAASAEIWERYYPTVRRIVFRSLGPGHDADDAIQEVFLRLYRKLSGLRDPSSLRAFVLAITVRVIKSEQRLKWLKRWLGLFEDGHTPPEDAGETPDLEAREALHRFYRILDRLSPTHRAAFVLRYVEGLELLDVAGALGVSRATIKRWLPRIARRVFSQVERDPLLSPYLARGGAFVVTHG
jgi:RNA polymerase sigma-70 factor (ECF subfamily)